MRLPISDSSTRDSTPMSDSFVLCVGAVTKEFEQLGEEADGKQQEAEDQAEIERRHQPAAGEDDAGRQMPHDLRFSSVVIPGFRGY